MNNPYVSNLTKIKWQGFFSAFRIFLAVQYVFFHQNNLNFTEIGFLVGAFFFGMFSFEILSGIFADHYGRKKAIALSSIAFGVSYFTFGLGQSFLAFFIASFLYGMGESFTSGSDEAIIYDSLKKIKKEKEFSRHFGKKWAFFMYGAGISSIVAFFVAKISLRATFFLSIITAVISLFFALSLKEPPQYKKQKNYFKHFKETLRDLACHKVVSFLLIVIISVNVVIQVYFQYIQFLLRDINIPVEFFGIAYAVFIIVAGYASHIAHSIEGKLGKTKTCSLIIGSLLLSLILPKISFTMYAVLLSIILVEFTFGMIGPIFNEYFHKYIDSHNRATASSIRSFAVGISVLLLAPLLGRVSDVLTYTNMLVFLAVAFLIVAYPATIKFLSKDV